MELYIKYTKFQETAFINVLTLTQKLFLSEILLLEN